MAKKRYTKRKDGRYQAKVRTSHYGPDGKPKEVYVYARTIAELEAKIRKLKDQASVNELLLPVNITLATYADSWFELKKSKKAINTKAMYTYVIGKHLKPALGDLLVSNITPAHCQQMVNDRWDHPELCSKIRMTFRQIERQALKDRLISGIIWDEDIEMPKNVRKKKRALTDIEQKALSTATLEPADKALLYVLYGCGLRREEALALSVYDVNLKARYVDVCHKIIFDKNTPIRENCAKSDSGIRKVPIPSAVFPYIQFYVLSLRSVSKDPEVWKSIMLFSNRKGGYVSRSGYVKTWKRILGQLNAAVATDDDPEPIRGLTAHIFRHNYATRLYYSGVSELKAIELMGHADGKMIREIYAHIDEGLENTQEKLDLAIAL